MFPRRGFTTWKHRCVDLWSGYVSGYWRCSSSVGIPVLSNMVSEPVWRPAPVVDRDREAELPHLHFLAFLYISGLKGLFHCGAHFSFRNTFRFTRKGFRLPKIRPLQSESGGIKFEYAFLNFCKVLIILVCIFFFQAATLLDLRMLFAPHLVWSRQFINR